MQTWTSSRPCMYSSLVAYTLIIPMHVHTPLIIFVLTMHIALNPFRIWTQIVLLLSSRLYTWTPVPPGTCTLNHSYVSLSAQLTQISATCILNPAFVLDSNSWSGTFIWIINIPTGGVYSTLFLLKCLYFICISYRAVCSDSRQLRHLYWSFVLVNCNHCPMPYLGIVGTWPLPPSPYPCIEGTSAGIWFTEGCKCVSIPAKF